MNRAFRSQVAGAAVRFALLAITAAGCGRGPMEPGAAGLTGVWSGTATSRTATPPTTGIAMNLTQTGSNVTGIYGAWNNGTVTGTVSGASATLTLAREDGACSATFQVQIAGNQMSGTHISGTCADATFTLTRR